MGIAVLDLDNTLICSHDEQIPGFDSRKIELSDKYWYVHKRPNLDLFLEYLRDNDYGIIVWTVGTHDYALEVCNYIFDKVPIIYILSRNDFYVSKSIYNISKPLYALRDLYNLVDDIDSCFLIDDNIETKYFQESMVINIKAFNVLNKKSINDEELLLIMNEINDKRKTS